MSLNFLGEIVIYITALGFLFLFILERYIFVHKICDEGSCSNLRHPKGGIYGAIELYAHIYMDGFAIGVGFQFNLSVGLVNAIAVVSHDFSNRLNTTTLMLKSEKSTKSTLRTLILDVSTP
ncbi:MAG: hypothetical protein JW891_09050 [Candidatus Lokiarchaeota archaeon]|nr:hypothetical protein [Candidatus Lokiarchaeota archaeon]